MTQTFNEVVNKMTSPMLTAPRLTAEENIQRLMKTIEYQLGPDGNNYMACKKVFEKDIYLNILKTDLCEFLSPMGNEVLQRMRCYVTNDVRQMSPWLSAVDGRIRAFPKYTFLVEEDKKREGGLCLRVILNTENMLLRWNDFFTALGFRDVWATSIEKLLKSVDDKGGIDVELVLLDEFQNLYGTRTDWLHFGKESYAVLEKGKMIITNSLWREFIRVRQPEPGVSPWGFRFTYACEKRVGATFRLNLYGSLWRSKK